MRVLSLLGGLLEQQAETHLVIFEVFPAANLTFQDILSSLAQSDWIIAQLQDDLQSP
jgi:hypothetical protein